MSNKIIKKSTITSKHQVSPPKNELKHYGVLGMKWGIRKDQQLTGGGRIKAGASVSRLTTKFVEEHEGSMYGVIDSKLGSVPGPERDFIATFVGDENSKIYQIDMKTKVDLILPGMKEKGEVVVTQLLKDAKFRKMVMEGSDNFIGKDRLASGFGDGRSEAIKRALKSKNFELDPDKTGILAFKDDDVQKAYTTFTQALNDKRVRGAYIDLLSKRGYNAVSDDLMDLDMKNYMPQRRMWYAEQASRKAEAYGTIPGLAIGAGAGMLGAGVFTPILGMAPSMIGGMMAFNKFLKNNPDDPMAISTSSLIIFNRGESLDVVRTRPYKPMQGRR